MPSLPTGRPRTYSVGDALEPDDLNDIFDQIIRMGGEGEFDVPILAHEGVVAASLELEGNPASALFHVGWDWRHIAFCEAQWNPTDDGDLLVHSDGYVSFAGVARLYVPLGLPGGVRLEQVVVRARRDTSNTFTATIKERLNNGTVNDLGDETTSAGALTEQTLVVDAGEHPVLEDASYWLDVLSDGSGPRFISARPYWSRPRPP